MNLHQLDLNLLTLFDALMRHKSVSRAAQEICISQSAFSHGLTRLRNRLGDQLFIRIDNVMQPTERAEKLAEQLKVALPLIEKGLNPTSDFNPLTSDVTYRITATDYTEYCLLPKLLPHFARVAPNVKLEVLPASQLSVNEQLMTNEIDFALGYSHSQFNSSTIEHHTWLSDEYCTLAKNDHPELKEGLTLEKFLSLSHVLIAPWGEKQGVVDAALANKKAKRNIAIQLPSLLVAPHIVKETELLLTLPKLIAEQFCAQNKCVIHQPPIEIPDYHLNIYWHKINSDKIAFKWFVEQISKLFLSS